MFPSQRKKKGFFPFLFLWKWKREREILIVRAGEWRYMTEKHVQLDATDWEILEKLRENARATFKEIGEAVKMSRPAVRERVLRMEEAGIISGYHAAVDPEALGKILHVMISFKFNSDFSYPEKPDDVLLRFLHASPEVLHYWKTYGDLDFLVEAAFFSKESMETFLVDMREYGFVRSHLIAASVERHDSAVRRRKSE